MQEEVPKEQAWQGGIRFERANKDSGQSVETFAMHAFFFQLFIGVFVCH